MSKKQVFISYRRADAGELADDVAAFIQRSFGRESVFIDTGHIPAGSRWSEVLEQRLELRKLYRVLEDSFASQHGMVRVIDESGEDYLYPNEFFVPIELPVSIEKVLAKIA